MIQPLARNIGRDAHAALGALRITVVGHLDDQLPGNAVVCECPNVSNKLYKHRQGLGVDLVIHGNRGANTPQRQIKTCPY